MRIELLTQEQHDELFGIYQAFPELTLQNTGYEGINRSELSNEAKEADKKINTILKDHIHRFSSFQNFRNGKNGEIVLRFQYGYDERFIGVGYIQLTELLNGFNA